ncbi:MAG: hypothetical protein QME25_04510 [Bacteroidota bacterium]|nr:hypothetical protein [Bacteroidota bacterium]
MQQTPAAGRRNKFNIITSQGPEDYLRSRGFELEILDNKECFV